MITDLFLAIRSGDLASVRRVIDSDSSLLWARDEGGNSPIIEAVHGGESEIAIHLSIRALQALRNHQIPSEDLYGILHDLGEAQFYTAEPDVAALLGSEDPELRYSAVSVLVFHWERSGYRRQLEELLLKDPAGHVRAIAARGLGHLFSRSQDFLLTRRLLQKLRDNNESGYVRLAAFDALRDLWVPATSEQSAKAIERRAAGAVVEVEDLRQARLRSNEDFATAQGVWDMAWSLEVDWELVERIERELSNQSRD